MLFCSSRLVPSSFCIQYSTPTRTTSNKKGRLRFAGNKNKKFGSNILNLVKNAPILEIRNPAWTSSPVSYFLLGVLSYTRAPSLVVTQIRGHTAGSSPPFPLRQCVVCIIIARRGSHFLPSSTRVELCLHALYLVYQR